MKIYDISMAIEPNMLVYKNYETKKPTFQVAADFLNGSHYETNLTMNLHTGTHIDAPLHMSPEGDTMEGYDLERFVTPVKVFDLTEVDCMIGSKDLINLDIKKDDFILFKTRNSFESTFNFEFISLAEDGAVYLANIGIKGVGIDALGIERAQPDHMTHLTLFNAGIIIIEGLVLKDVSVGNYQMIALPLKIANVEAAPTRAILIET